jgi:hypothetical protein
MTGITPAAETISAQIACLVVERNRGDLTTPPADCLAGREACGRGHPPDGRSHVAMSQSPVRERRWHSRAMTNVAVPSALLSPALRARESRGIDRSSANLCVQAAADPQGQRDRRVVASRSVILKCGHGRPPPRGGASVRCHVTGRDDNARKALPAISLVHGQGWRWPS